MSQASSVSPQLIEQVERASRRRKLWTYVTFAIVAVYLTLSFAQFDIFGIARQWSAERASIFILDSYAHKDHVTMRWSTPDKVRIAFEGGYREIYKTPPKWFKTDPKTGAHVISFDNGGTITYFKDRVEMANWPDTNETFVFTRDANEKPKVVGYEGRRDELPSWMRWTENKVEVRPTLYERLQVYGGKVEVHRYEIGWKYFWFDFSSPLVGKSLFEAIGLMFSDERVDPSMSNASLVLKEFLDNEQWQHGTVLFSMLETILMAVLGTFLACFVGLPLAFLAAKNITPFSGIRFILRRFFDLLRGVDMLIWSLIFLRAFGPGLFTGIFAIAFTDTGTMGKLMSEAIENTDAKQREGMQSTGATRVQQHRFGIIPQILPVFISQSLYYLESNTRGAVIIGAMGAGGIGLQFLGALQTGNDWENVAYMALLVLLTVILMDTMSAWLRRRLIGIESDERTKKRSRSRSTAVPTPQGA